MSRIVLTGASGYLGGVLIRHLADRGHNLTVISRRKPALPAGTQFAPWDGEHLGAWVRHIDGAEAVINLAGKSVNCRYNEANRNEILKSRLATTNVVGEAIRIAASPPRVWLNASSATIYRDSRDLPMDECTGELGEGFSVDVCRAWEAEFFEPELPSTRRVAMRSSMVFGVGAPVFQVFERLVKLGLGGHQGDGGQMVSWIHEADFMAATEFVLTHENLHGPVNICAPNPLPNRDFMAALRHGFGMPLGLWAPRLAMEIGAFFMRTETELPLKSRFVIPGHLLNAGFRFQFTDWPAAVRDIVARVKSS